jgi:hypothetical protein
MAPQHFARLANGSILLFAICQGILLYCAGWTVYQTVPHTAAGWRDYKGLFANKTFVQMAMSLMVGSSIDYTLLHDSIVPKPTGVLP